MDQHTALVNAVRDVLNTGVSMRGLASKAGVSHATISKLLGDDAVNVSLKTYQKLMSAAGVEMKTTTIHDHASASLAQIEQAALDRGIKADIGLRDTELECLKYRRVMALEAELDAWKLRYERMKASYNAAQSNAEHGNKKMADQHEAILKLGAEIQKKDAWIDNQDAARNQLQKDLQIMSASWKAVSVERDNLEGCIMQREQQIKSCENALIESREKCKTQQVLIDLRDAQIALNKNAALIAERESKRLIDKAKSQRNACQAVAFLAVALFLLAVFGGGA